MTSGALDPAVRKLAVAVLEQAARDAAGHGGVAAQARGWLQSRNPWLAFWCHCAGVAPEVVRRWDVRPFVVPADDASAQHVA
jgi:hypothetical protein